MREMTIQLESNNGKCLYEQIYEHIRQEIREGKLLAQERLPSTRSLAVQLQVARSTVDYAYDQLLSEGYIEARPYRGFFVATAPDSGLPWAESAKESVEAQDQWRPAEPDAKQWAEYDFSPNGIDMSVFPFGVWKRISKEILSDGNSELFSRGEPQGDRELRVTISRYLHSSRGVNCSPEQIIVGAGNDYLLLLLEKILGRKIRIAMENPTYRRTYRIFASCGYEVVTVGMDENGMSVDELNRADTDAAYVMPSHQFPTGTIMPIGRRMELLKWAEQKRERYLIEDDYDSEFRYRGKPIPALQSVDANGRVIYIGTFSKAIAPAIRVGYMVLPMQLLKRYRENCGFYSCTVSRIDQRILNEFIRDGYFERHLNKMRKLYRGKHDLLLQCLAPLEGHVEIAGENAGLHILLRHLDGMSEEELLRTAEEQGVKVYGLSESLVAANGETDDSGNPAKQRNGTVLIGFGGLTQEEILAGASKLCRAWTEKKG